MLPELVKDGKCVGPCITICNFYLTYFILPLGHSIIIQPHHNGASELMHKVKQDSKKYEFRQIWVYLQEALIGKRKIV